MNALRLGDRLVYDDSDCTVEAIGAGSIHLRSDAGSLYALTPTAALAALHLGVGEGRGGCMTGKGFQRAVGLAAEPVHADADDDRAGHR
ncbi:MAG: hypothetical protein WCI74_18540 [Actinomycetes bacterium]